MYKEVYKFILHWYYMDSKCVLWDVNVIYSYSKWQNAL